MLSSSIWVVLFAWPDRKISLAPLNDERFRVGADMMSLRRFSQAKQMIKGDRIVIQHGGPQGSAPQAQYLVYAGCVQEAARNLTQGDTERYKRLLDLTCEMFPGFQRASGLLERQGIIKYRLFSPSQGIPLLFRPHPQLMPGDNFKQFPPELPEYSLLDGWWRKVVPQGEYGKD